MKYEEIKECVKARKEKERILRKQIDEKYQMLVDGGFSSDRAYKMLVGKSIDFKTLKRWHKKETVRPWQETTDTLHSLIEEEKKNELDR